MLFDKNAEYLCWGNAKKLNWINNHLINEIITNYKEPGR